MSERPIVKASDDGKQLLAFHTVVCCHNCSFSSFCIVSHTKTHSEASKELSWESLASTHKLDRKLLTADEVALIKTYFCVCAHFASNHLSQTPIFHHVFTYTHPLHTAVIQNLGKNRGVRPRVVATAIMYFRRFYTRFVTKPINTQTR